MLEFFCTTLYFPTLLWPHPVWISSTEDPMTDALVREREGFRRQKRADTSPPSFPSSRHFFEENYKSRARPSILRISKETGLTGAYLVVLPETSNIVFINYIGPSIATDDIASTKNCIISELQNLRMRSSPQMRIYSPRGKSPHMDRSRE